MTPEPSTHGRHQLGQALQITMCPREHMTTNENSIELAYSKALRMENESAIKVAYIEALRVEAAIETLHKSGRDRLEKVLHRDRTGLYSD